MFSSLGKSYSLYTMHTIMHTHIQVIHIHACIHGICFTCVYKYTNIYVNQGTYMLVLTVGLNVLGSSKAAAFSIAASLTSMIYALGDVSGASPAESGGLATNPPCDKPIEDYSTLHKSPRQGFVTEGPRQRYVTEGGRGGTRQTPISSHSQIYVYGYAFWSLARRGGVYFS